MKSSTSYLFIGALALSIAALLSSDVLSQQRGGGGARGGGGGRSTGHRAPSVSRGGSHGPAMSRPQPKSISRPQTRPSAQRTSGASRPSASRPSASRPSTGATGSRGPATGTRTPAKQPAKTYKRPGSSSGNRPSLPANRPSTGATRPGAAAGARPRPATRPSSAQLDDFLGTGSVKRPGTGTTRPGSGSRPGGNIQRPGDNDRRPNLGDGNRNNIGDRDRTNIGDRDRTNIGDRDRTNIGDRNIGSRDVNVGNINVDKSVNFTQNRQQWVDNRHVTGNRVRANVGNRYDRVYRDGAYRGGVVGGYGYHTNWNNNGPYYGWRVPTYAAVGGFLGASLVNTQPVYYAYGSGGNVYYENNTVYVDGQASGTPEQYAQEAIDYVAAAPEPDQVPEEDWLPLGVFALTGEDLADSNSMIELAINKQGVVAGTYYSDATGTSRPLKGTFDSESQRAAIGFADGKNADLALETGIYNLTQDEAPALLHHGTEQSSSVLLVRLPPPEDEAGS